MTQTPGVFAKGYAAKIKCGVTSGAVKSMLPGFSEFSSGRIGKKTLGKLILFTVVKKCGLCVHVCVCLCASFILGVRMIFVLVRFCACVCVTCMPVHTSVLFDLCVSVCVCA